MEEFNKIKVFFTLQLEIIAKKQQVFLENFEKGIFTLEDFEKMGFKDFSLAFDKSNDIFFKKFEKIEPEEVKLVDLKRIDMDKNIQDCITEPINNNYDWGKYGDFKVVICKKNGYINGSYLYAEAVAFENAMRRKKGIDSMTPPKINKWFDNDGTADLIESASENNGIPVKELMFINGDKQKKGQEMLKGTYLHPILINSLAMWISTKYALKINELVNSFHAKTERERVARLLDKKDDLISRLEKMVNDTATRFDISVKNNEIQVNKLTKIIINNETQVNKLSKIVGYTETVAKDIRLNTTDDNTHMIFIYKFLNIETEEVFYKCYRLHNKSLSTIKKEKKKYNTLRFICVFSENCVNSIQTWNKIKDENKKIIIDKNSKSGTRFTLKKNYTDFMLIGDIYSLMSERIREIANLKN